MNNNIVLIRNDLETYSFIKVSKLINTFKRDNTTHKKFDNNYNILRWIIKSYPILCTRCNFVRARQIHHTDKDSNNNSLNNLEILCNVCHRGKHHSLTSSLRNSIYNRNNNKILKVIGGNKHE